MLRPYIEIARPDHWFKNVFMLPGVLLAVLADPELLDAGLILPLVMALASVCLIASSNYVINEVLDAPYDALHPVKKNRPVPSGKIIRKWAYLEWVLLFVAGLVLAWPLGIWFVVPAVYLWIMGCVYNIPPIRSKDRPYIDVLSESINNPLRLMLGWYATGIELMLPLSLLMAYWMLGAFFMTVKRFAEFRSLRDASLAAQYRASFRFYNEQILVVATSFYCVTFGLFAGIFLIHYRLELILTIPFLAGFIAWYLHIGFKKDSPAQNPEKLYKEKFFMGYLVFCVCFTMVTLLVDVPILYKSFQPTTEVVEVLQAPEATEISSPQ